MVNHPIRDFADNPLKTSEDFRLACNGARRSCNELADAMLFLARVALTKLKKHEAAAAARRQAAAKKAGADRRTVWLEGRKHYGRARTVAAAMRRAAGYQRSCAKACDKVYQVFVKHYGSDLDARPRADRRAS